VCDHRLRVLFPTGLDASHSFADSPFAIVERPIAIPPESATWKERIVPEKPLTSLCGVQDGHAGLAVLAPFGPNEYAVLDDPDRAIALTLFRSTLKTVHTQGEPGGQLLETMTFDYLLLPFSGPFDAVQALRHVAEAQTGVRRHFAEEARAPESFLRLRDNRTVMTALKPAADGDGGVVRLWNPTNEDLAETVVFGRPLSHAALCNLNEEAAEDLPLGDNPDEVRVVVPAGGLVTVRCRWE
jgi:alpha-mannosidase